IDDVRRDAAFELERLLLVVTFVANDDLEPAVEICELAQLLSELLEREFEDVLEDVGVGVERDLGAAAVGDARLLELGLRNATAVVLDGHRVVEVDDNIDPRAVSREMLVDRVVDDLVHEVMQTRAVIGIADVHAGALANTFETL